MIDNVELLDIKARMLLAAEVAELIAIGGEESIELDEVKYAAAHDALTKLRGDVLAVLTELDVLRGITKGSFDLLAWRPNDNAAGVDAGNSGGDVPTDRPEDSNGDGEVGGDNTPETSGVVGSSGPYGQDSPRPKSRRNRKRRTGNSEGVG